MKMHPDKQTILRRALPFLGSLAITAALFLALPLTQWASEGKATSQKTELTTVAVNPPPPPQEFELPEQEDSKEEEVELKQDLQKISLNQIDLAINGGMGGATFNVNSFQLSDDFADDLVFEIADLDEQPQAIVQSAPVYPSNLKRTGIQGRVIVIFIVDEQGNTSKARIVESSHPDFSASALAVVQSWKFEPGKKDGKSVKTRVRIPLSFSLRR